MDKKYLFCNGDSWVVGHMLDTEWMRNKHLSNQNITYVQFKKQIGEQDEWTWFVENTDYHHEAHLEQVKGKFTGVVSDKLGLEEINIAQPGKSNESIVRTTIEWMLDNKDILDETFFLIGLTTSRRTESVNVDKDMYIHDWNPNKDSENCQILTETINTSVHRFHCGIIAKVAHPLICRQINKRFAGDQ